MSQEGYNKLFRFLFTEPLAIFAITVAAFVLFSMIFPTPVASRPGYMVYKRGVLYFGGRKEAPLTCSNNSASQALIQYRGKKYICPSYSETEIFK